MTTIQNFVFKIETGLGKRVIQPILGTRNLNDVCTEPLGQPSSS